jgi:hypothetical protein
MDIEEGPATYPGTSPERFLEEGFLAQLPAIQGFRHMITIRGGREDGEREDDEREDGEGE